MSALKTNFDALPDEEVEDMGMYRCGHCGKTVYPDGSGVRHCELPDPELLGAEDH